jgi:outer membrane receptor protein involved in Fe transport
MSNETRRARPALRDFGAIATFAVAGSAASAAVERHELALEEVVVTATRHATELLRYPGSASVIQGDTVELVAATHHAEIMNRAAGVMIQRNSGQESLTAVRSPVLTGPGSCGSFLFLEDGISIRPVGFCNVNELFEVNTEQAAAIEILRGPSTALYGSSGMHGAINVLTPDPGSLPRLGVGLEAGPDDYGRIRLAAGNSTVGIAAHATHDGGWRESSGYDEQKVNLAFARPDREGLTELKLTATHLDQQTAGFIQGEDAYRDPELARSNPNPEAYRKAHSVRLRGRIEHTFERAGTLTAQPYLRSSRMEFLQHFLLGKPLEKNGQDSGGVLVSMTHTRGASEWLFGTDLEYARSTLLEVQDGPTLEGPPAAQAIRPAGRHYDYSVDATLAAVWLHLEQRLTPRWSLIAGARLEHVGYDYDNRMIAGNTDDQGVPCPLGGCLYSRPSDRDDSFTNFAPKLSLAWLISADHTAWMTATRGFRAPETSELYRLQRQQNVAELDSEQIDSLEIGLRGRWPRFTYSVAAYAMTKDNVILRDADGFNVDDGRTRHRGLEYELTFVPTPGLALSAAGSLAHHTYAFDGFDGGESIVSGRDVDTAPRQIHGARVSWQPSSALALELEWQHVGAYWLDAANAHRYGGHDLLNLRAEWAVARGWSIAARLNNLTDEVYADRADFAIGNYRYFPGRDRTLFVEARYTLD